MRGADAGDHLDGRFRKPVMAFHIHHEMPMAALRNGQPDRRFLGDAADVLEVKNLGKALEIRRRHQPDIVRRRSASPRSRFRRAAR